MKLDMDRVTVIPKKNPLEVSCQLWRNCIYAIRKNRNNQCLMYFYRLCLYSSPKTYSKSRWKLAYEELCLSWRRIHWKFHVNSKGMVFMPLEKTGIINVLCIFTDFDFIFLPKCTVNPVESWHRKSYVYPEEESIGSFMSTQKDCFLCH